MVKNTLPYRLSLLQKTKFIPRFDSYSEIIIKTESTQRDKVCEYFGIENFQNHENIFTCMLIHKSDIVLCFILSKSRDCLEQNIPQSWLKLAI